MAKLLTDTLMMSWFDKPSKMRPARIEIKPLAIKTSTKSGRKFIYK